MFNNFSALTNEIVMAILCSEFLIRIILLSLTIYKLGEDIMLEITDAATVKIADYFRGREVAPIRIFLNEGG